MQKTFRLAVLLAMCLFAAEALAQTAAPQTGPNITSLCVLQKKVAEGERETVRVSGMYGPGMDRTVLEDAKCPNESTWVELALRSQENKEKLRKLLGSSRRAYVVVEGEFYGPPLPDPKLPETIRKDYHPGWGHLAAFKTKLVVHAIREVKAAPTDHTNGASSSEATHYPNLIHADFPCTRPWLGPLTSMALSNPDNRWETMDRRNDSRYLCDGFALLLYFLKRFSNACRASSGRAGEGASVGVWVGCMYEVGAVSFSTVVRNS